MNTRSRVSPEGRRGRIRRDPRDHMSHPNYRHVVAVLNRHWRIIHRLGPHSSWVLQYLAHGARSERARKRWAVRGHYLTREALLAAVQRHVGTVHPATIKDLASLPERIRL